MTTALTLGAALPSWLLAGTIGAAPFMGRGDDVWQSQLGQSLREENAYAARVEGMIPAGLRGTLYRNGPGLFDRGGARKSNILDGDGMVQAFAFADDGVCYRNRFVRTEKFVEEDAQDRFSNPT